MLITEGRNDCQKVSENEMKCFRSLSFFNNDLCLPPIYFFFNRKSQVGSKRKNGWSYLLSLIFKEMSVLHWEQELWRQVKRPSYEDITPEQQQFNSSLLINSIIKETATTLRIYWNPTCGASKTVNKTPCASPDVHVMELHR